MAFIRTDADSELSPCQAVGCAIGHRNGQRDQSCRDCFGRDREQQNSIEETYKTGGGDREHIGQAAVCEFTHRVAPGRELDKS